MNRLILVITFMVFVASGLSSPDQLLAADQDSAAQSQTRKVSRNARAVSAEPAKGVLQPASLDAAIDRFLKSDTYRRAQSAARSGKAEKIEFTISITPEQTLGEACICAGGKGSLGGNPTEWPCDCDPPGCGSCGAKLSSN